MVHHSDVQAHAGSTAVAMMIVFKRSKAGHNGTLATSQGKGGCVWVNNTCLKKMAFHRRSF